MRGYGLSQDSNVSDGDSSLIFPSAHSVYVWCRVVHALLFARDQNVVETARKLE